MLTTPSGPVVRVPITFPFSSVMVTGNPDIGVPFSFVAFSLTIPLSVVMVTFGVCLSVVTDTVLFTGLLSLSPG